MRNRKMLKGAKIGKNELLTSQIRGLFKRAKDLTFQAYWARRVMVYIHPEGEAKGKKVLIKSESDLYKVFNDQARHHRS